MANFRMLYYNQLGMRNVDNMKELDNLLKSDPVDTEKLAMFAHQFPLPSVYRTLVWKFLLEIVPPYKDSIQFVEKHRKGHCEDLVAALLAMRAINKSDCHGGDGLVRKISYMYMVEHGMLSVTNMKHSKQDGHRIKILESICKVVCEIIHEDWEIYWVTSRFFQRYFVHILENDKLLGHYSKHPAYVENYVRTEEPDLYEHLYDLQLFKVLPFHNWFESCFAQQFVSHPECLERIWDKIIAGSCNILIFVSVALLLTCSVNLRKANSAEIALKVINQVSKESGHMIVDKTMELWDRHKNTLSIELNCKH